MSVSKAVKVPPVFIVKVIQFVQEFLIDIRRSMAPPFVHVLEMAAGGMKSQLIYMVAQLEIADRLKDGERTISDLAMEIGCNEENLYRFMRALTMYKIIKQTSDGTFKTTKYCRTLEKKHPKSIYPLALLTGESFWRDPVGDLFYSINTGETSFDHIFGKNYFEYLKDNPQKLNMFSRWMDSSSNINCPIIAASFPFSKYKKIIDIGGGYGSLIAHILKRHPKVSGILFDLPEVVENPRSIDESISDRCEIVAGNFMESVPTGGNLYVMQQIIHDWDDETSIRILSNCKKSMKSDGRILIIDSVIKQGNRYDMSKIIDLQMMAICHGGKERTQKQFELLLEKSGLELVKIHDTTSIFSIIEAKIKR